MLEKDYFALDVIFLHSLLNLVLNKNFILFILIDIHGINLIIFF